LENTETPSEVALDALVADWADQLRSIAKTGLHYSPPGYDRERYERLLELAAEMASALVHRPAGDLLGEWRADEGYVTPKVGVAAAVFDDADRLLLIKRADNGLWALPGGWADSGAPAAANVVREVAEETGLIVRIDRLIGVYDSRRNGSRLVHHFYDLIFACTAIGGTAAVTAEALAVDYFGPDTLPDIVPTHVRPIRDAFAARAGKLTGAAFEQ
jgi:ADP-ribose pyrophosphatase YjhB (NUDIX family)